jgi:endonuclease YncB( thermonuclease family)
LEGEHVTAVRVDEHLDIGSRSSHSGCVAPKAWSPNPSDPLVSIVAVLALVIAPAAATAPSAVYRIDHVVDGDTVDLTTGAKVRLVQIDTPEVYFGVECYGRQASAITKRLLPAGTRVRLAVESAADRIDRYGRLLRYVIRARDGLNMNVYLVRIGAAAPYFYDRQRGRDAALLDRLARRARALHRGLWGACPHTPYDPYRGVATRR